MLTIAGVSGAAGIAAFGRALRRGTWPARLRAVVLVGASAAAGFVYAAALATLRLADGLPLAGEGTDVLVEGVVSSLPARMERGVRFEFDVERVLTPGATVPRRVLLGWYGEGPVLRPADRW